MRIPRIHLPLDLSSKELIELTAHAFQHAVKVLRMKQGSKIIVFNGEGKEFFATLKEVTKKKAFIQIEELIENNSESKLSIHLGLGISKGERMDFAIQKAVELGVTKITPLFTEHCVVNLDEQRLKKRLQHWQGIMVSACEQSGRHIIPLLNEASSLIKWSDSISETALIFDPTAIETLKNIKPKENRLALIIGPEGGLSANEISELRSNENFYSVKFGPRILRTETAALSAITAIQLLWGDLLQ